LVLHRKTPQQNREGVGKHNESFWKACAQLIERITLSVDKVSDEADQSPMWRKTRGTFVAAFIEAFVDRLFDKGCD
jgi:hypothetical protein